MIGTYMEIVSKLGEYYSKELTANQIEMFSEDLMLLTPDELIRAIKSYRQNPENKFFPLPGQLIGIIRPPITSNDDAQECANLIISAIGRYGHTNQAQAQEYMGELAWEVVKRVGGWLHLCEAVNAQNENTYRAQIRELSKTVQKKSLRGELHETPSLPVLTEMQSKAKYAITHAMKSLPHEQE